MKQTLLNLFKPYKPVPDVTAHKNVRMRGQAFVTFPDVEMANKARKEVGQFPLYGKPMVRDQIQESGHDARRIGLTGSDIWYWSWR